MFTFFKSLFIILGMADDQPTLPSQADMDLPLETPCSVEQWCKNSKERYITFPEYRDYMVVQVIRYKNTSGTQHEYLVVKVRHPLQDGDKYLRIERALAHVESTGEPILNSNQKGTTPSTSSDISAGTWANWSKSRSNPRSPEPPKEPTAGSTLWNSRKEGAASDIVRLWKPPNTFLTVAGLTDSKVLENLEFESNPLPLVHLAILAHIVHEEESLYNLFLSQCYWYANMITRVIAREKRIATPIAEAGDPVTDTDYCYHPSSGKFWIIPVHSVRPKVISRIQEEFKKRSGMFDVDVRHILQCVSENTYLY